MTRYRKNGRRRPLSWLGDAAETVLDLLLWWT